jgi:UPF0176 protein
MATFLTAALYKFVALPDFAALQAPLQDCCEEHDVKGTLLLAEEGINGTIAGLPEDVRAVLEFLRRDPRLADLTHKESFAAKPPFYRLKVRLKREIVTMGVHGVDPTKMAGRYVKAEDWNALISDPNVVVVDTRNDYEVAIGTFKGALNPETKSFSELPAWVRQEKSLREKPKVAMFCTGGIRCEKSTAFLRSEGFDEVYHLEGGILKYLETVPEEESLWQGECFVFDERVSVGHGLQQGKFEFCRACRMPINAADKASEFFVLGISCPHCHDQKTAAQKSALAERQRQIVLAQRRNQPHIGARFDKKPKEKPSMRQTDATPASAQPILYSFRRCPYAMRARLALMASGQICELREVVLRDKPHEMLAASAKATVPVLVTSDGHVLDESLDIMLWALQQHDPEHWLSPQQGSREAMLALIAQCDGEFKYHLDRYKYPERYKNENENVDAQSHRAAGAAFLQRLNAQLSATPYLFGAHAALADMAIAPFVRQFAQTDQDWFCKQPWPQLQAWLSAIVDAARYERIMQKYPRWESGTAGVFFPAPSLLLRT